MAPFVLEAIGVFPPSATTTGHGLLVTGSMFGLTETLGLLPVTVGNLAFALVIGELRARAQP